MSCSCRDSTDPCPTCQPDRSGCPAPRHGNENAYRQGCRCVDAREANRIARKRRREGRHLPARLPQIGTARRLQGLAAIGWPQYELAARMGVEPTFVGHLRRVHPGGLVQRATAEKVRRLYAELSMLPGPSSRTRRWAELRNWAPPLLWDDDIIDDPTGRPVRDIRSGRRSRLADARWLMEGGVSLELAARQVGVTVEALERAGQRERAS